MRNELGKNEKNDLLLMGMEELEKENEELLEKYYLFFKI